MALGAAGMTTKGQPPLPPPKPGIPPVRGVLMAGVLEAESVSYLDDSILKPRGFVMLIKGETEEEVSHVSTMREDLHLSPGRDRLNHIIAVDPTDQSFFVAEDKGEARVGKYRLKTSEPPSYLSLSFPSAPHAWMGPIALAVDPESGHLWILLGPRANPAPVRRRIEIETGFNELYSRIFHKGKEELRGFVQACVKAFEREGLDAQPLADFADTYKKMGSLIINEEGYIRFMDHILCTVFNRLDAENSDVLPYHALGPVCSAFKKEHGVVMAAWKKRWKDKDSILQQIDQASDEDVAMRRCQVTRAEFIEFIMDYIFDDLDVLSITSGMVRLIKVQVVARPTYHPDVKNSFGNDVPGEDVTTVLIWDHRRDIELKRLTVTGTANDLAYDPASQAMYLVGTHIHRIACFDPALEPPEEVSKIPRRDVMDLGDPERPRGWYDAQKQGVKADYGRWVEILAGSEASKPDRPTKMWKWAVALGGTTGGDEINLTYNEPSSLEELSPNPEWPCLADAQFEVMTTQPVDMIGDFAVSVNAPPKRVHRNITTKEKLPSSAPSVSQVAVSHYFGVGVYSTDVDQPRGDMQYIDITKPLMGSSIGFGGDGNLWISGASRSVKRGSEADVPMLFRIDIAREVLPPDADTEIEHSFETVGPPIHRGQGITMDPTYSGRCVWIATGQRVECVSRTGHLHGSIAFPGPVRHSWLMSTVQEGDVMFAFDEEPISDVCAPKGEIGTKFVPKQSGYREETFHSGKVYKGQWLKGQRFGWGIETTPHGANYVGEWQNDRRYGYGCSMDQHHGAYAGHWAKGLKKDASGRAVFVTAPTISATATEEVSPHPDSLKLHIGGYPEEASDVCMGQADDDELSGQGKRYFCSGGFYQGEWAEGNPHGQGIYTWPDESSYEGQFEGGRIQGLGALREPGMPPVHGIFKRGMIVQRSGALGAALPPTSGRQRCGELMPGFEGGNSNNRGQTGDIEVQPSDEEYEKLLRHRLDAMHA